MASNCARSELDTQRVTIDMKRKEDPRKGVLLCEGKLTMAARVGIEPTTVSLTGSRYCL